MNVAIRRPRRRQFVKLAKMWELANGAAGVPAMKPLIRPGLPNPVWWVLAVMALIVLLWVLFAWRPEGALT
jgi:hypothetical protein